MGAVYEAVHEAIARQAAIKVLHPEYSVRPDILKRFFNEARAVNLIDHPGIVQIFDYGQTADQTAYIVMELLRGEPLSKRIKQRGSMSAAEALPIAIQVASALAAVHTKQIVHRDLKPENIMLVADLERPEFERAKLLDFGIAKLAEGATVNGEKTRTNMMMGTPPYMSPEQCRGSGVVDDRSDVYAFGVMLYEMLAGRRPFVAEGAGSYIIMHMTDPPPRLRDLAPHVSAPIAAFVHRLLAKQRDQRPSMQEVVVELRRLSESGRGQALISLPSWLGFVRSALRWPTGASHHLRRWPQLAAAATLGVLICGGVAYFLLLRSPSPTSPSTIAAKTESPVAVTAVSQVAPALNQAPGLPVSPATIEWYIVTDPSGVQVTRKDSGAVLGMTPLRQRQLAQSAAISVLLRKPGYQPTEVTLPGDASSNIEKRLIPLTARPATPVSKSTRPPQLAVEPTSSPGSRNVPRSSADQTRTKDKHHGPKGTQDLLEN